MSENLNWNFNITDGISGPASQMAAALKDLQGKMGSVTINVNLTQKAVKDVGGGLKETAGILGQATAAWGAAGLAIQGVKQVMDPIVQAGGWVMSEVFQFEKGAVDALAFKETTLTSLQTLLGSAEEAQAFFSQAAWLGKATPFETKDVVDSYRKLLSAGFSKEEVPIAFQGIADVAATQGFDVNIMDRLTLALGQIKGAGKLMGQDLMQVVNATAAAGVGRMTIFDAIGARMGITGKEAGAKMSAGLIDSETAILAIFDAIQKKTSGGVLGGGTKAMENTYAGLMSTLGSTFADFFITLDGTADEVAGFGVLKGSLMNLKEALDTTKPAGKALQASVVGAFNSITTSIFGATSGPNGLQTMEGMVLKVSGVVENLGKVVGAAFEGAGSFVRAFLGDLGLLDGTASGLFDGPLSAEKVRAMTENFKEFGSSAGKQLGELAKSLATIASAMASINGASAFLSKALTPFPEWKASAEKTGPAALLAAGNAPSVAAELRDEKPNADMSKTPGGGGGSQNVQVTVNVDASGAKEPAEVGKATADAVVRDGIPPMLRRMSAQIGAD